LLAVVLKLKGGRHFAITSDLVIGEREQATTALWFETIAQASVEQLSILCLVTVDGVSASFDEPFLPHTLAIHDAMGRAHHLCLGGSGGHQPLLWCREGTLGLLHL